jgi:hypothetical protein
MYISSHFIAETFGGKFFILRKLLPISVEPGWVCTLAVIRQAPNFLKNDFWICNTSFLHYTLTVKAVIHSTWP